MQPASDLDDGLLNGNRASWPIHRVQGQPHGIEYDHFIEDVSVRMPTPQEAQSLHLLPGVPVIRLLRTAFATGGPLGLQPKPVEVIDYVIAGDRHVLSYRASYQDRWTGTCKPHGRFPAVSDQSWGGKGLR